MTGVGKNSSFLKNTSLTTASQVCGLLATAVGGILTARYLGPEGKGQVALAMTTGFLLARILCLGLDQAVPYYLASRKMAPQYVLGNCVLIILFALGVGYLCIYPALTRYLLDSLLSGLSVSLLYLGSLTFILYLLRLFVNSMLAGFQQFGKQTLHNLAISVGSILSGIIALIVLGVGPGGYIGLHVLFGAGTLLVGFWKVFQVVSPEVSISLDKAAEMLKYGLKSMLAQLLTLVDLRLDIYLINLFLSISSVGIYTVAVSVGTLFWVIPNGIAAALFPRAAAVEGKDSERLTAFVCRNTLWFTVMGSTAVALVSKPLFIFVFGEMFQEAALAFALLVPGIIGQVVARICFTDCAARGYPEKATISMVFTAVLTIFFDLMLIPRLGISGAALASSIAYVASGMMALYWHLRLSSNRLSSLLLPKVSDLTQYKLLI